LWFPARSVRPARTDVTRFVESVTTVDGEKRREGLKSRYTRLPFVQIFAWTLTDRSMMVQLSSQCPTPYDDEAGSHTAFAGTVSVKRSPSAITAPAVGMSNS